MPTATPLVTGYYRCTDILYNVSLAMSYRDALLHPEHPLSIEGKVGIHTFLGQFHNGESRYLFSSAQVDYLRYWLHAMNITSEIIPIPSSECLFTPSELSNVEPIAHSSKKSFREAMKKAKKIIKRLEGCDTSLVSWRKTFERVRSFWAAKTGVWCAVDFETWTGDYTHNVITEFGYSYIHWNSDGAEERHSGHFTVKEHRLYRNGQYKVPERRENYNFEEFGTGKSVEVTKAGLKATVSNLIAGMHIHGPIFLVFHDPGEDIKALNRLDAPINAAFYQLPDTMPTEGIFIVDTAVLFGALVGKVNNKSGLEQVCNHLGIKTEFLHNAGNDAYYTLDALREMASGEPLDTQAEKRWPKWNPEPGDATGLAIQLPPTEADSNSDSELEERNY
ncbi:hypothetical protein B0H19DRAFT_1153971 [Mycena capillaripes]|nr:hypothetical protein B0H19DRAFT_1153971 [Mycena capillaripes]